MERNRTRPLRAFLVKVGMTLCTRPWEHFYAHPIPDRSAYHLALIILALEGTADV